MEITKKLRGIFAVVLLSWWFVGTEPAHALSDENRTYLALGIVAALLLAIDTSGELSFDSQERQQKSPFPHGFEPFAEFEPGTESLKSGIRYRVKW